MAILRRRFTHRAPNRQRSRLIVSGLVVALAAGLVSVAAHQPQLYRSASQPNSDESAQPLAEDMQVLLGSAMSAKPVRVSLGTRARTVDGKVRIDPISPGGSYTAALSGTLATDVQLTHSLRLDRVDAGDTGLYEQAIVRRQDNGDHYKLTTVVRTGGRVALRLDRRVGAQDLTLSRTATITTVKPGVPLMSQVRVSGTSPVLVQARVWQQGAAMPNWQVIARDSAANRITAPGSQALAGYLSRASQRQSLLLSDIAITSLDVPGGQPSTQPTSAAPTATPAPSTSASASQPPTQTPAPSASVTPEPSATTTVPAPMPTTKPTKGAGFQHPGIVVSADRLAFVRTQVAAGREPWTAALARTKNSFYAKPTWVPRPIELVQCGAYSNPNIGCTQETDDAQAAYTNALLFSLTGERRYADKAIEILDAWSGTLKGHSFDTQVYKNGRLQSAWAAETFTKAAELIRYSNAGWSPQRIERFEQMLRNAFLPMVRDGWTGGGANWQLSMAEATINIGVFLDDRAVFEDGVGDWRAQIVSAFYLRSDGAQPIPPLGTYVKPSHIPTYWYGASAFVDGLGQETCRDLGHTSMGLAAAINAAETAKIQGLDLYEEQRPRLTAAMEYNTKYLANPSAAGWVCPKPVDFGGTAGQATYEIGLRHYAVEEGVSLPNTKAWVERNRPTRTGIFMNWETLTHGS